ncbi:hypothetical protein C2869_07335 [Saccharobesus litoralis]|uniref:peptidylprolyl isomerase n=1 Tax=Saccharobesus litoralis TaxID=2172099 RepID=A0A2S0VPX0_9ALTE|nr:peptidyl-prolyl cis-trans isomerase [Saccharobesus litoralis]AWB66254.1 hypothetical protein C2869_07335 [Saccharobesus litoralis]
MLSLRSISLCFASLSVCLLAACSKQQTEQAVVDPVVATVNGSNILQSQLDFELERTLSNVPDIFVDERVKGRVLDSLVLSQLMAQLQSSGMDESELSELDKEVAAFRQKKLVERYIRNHVEASPVTKQQVQDYYQNNLDEFGQKDIKFWRRIRVEGATNHPEAQNIAKTLSAVASSSHFKQVTLAGVNFVVTEGTNEQDNLSPTFAKLLNATNSGQISDLQIDGNAMYRLAVTKTYLQPAKPLNQVKREIQKRLSQQAWKRAIKAHGDKLRAQADISLVPEAS